MMKAKYLEVAQIGIYSPRGEYVEFKAGETKDISNETAELLKLDSRFQIIDTVDTGNKAPDEAVKKEVKKKGR